MPASRGIYQYKPSQYEKIPEEVEYRSDIYYNTKSKKYGYTRPYGIQDPTNTGRQDPSKLPVDTIFAGVTHNHTNHDPTFSYKGNSAAGKDKEGDMESADRTGFPTSVIVQDSRGEVIRKYTPADGSTPERPILRGGTVTTYNPT